MPLAWIQRLLQAPSRISTPDDLAEFVAAQGAFVSQKATIDYLRARAGLAWMRLFDEQDFRAALDYCRWEAYAAVLQDVVELAAILLRRAEAPVAPLPRFLAGLVEAALARYPLPSYRASWSDVVQETEQQLRLALARPPRPVGQVGRRSAGRIFPILPIWTNLADADRDMVENHICFLLVGVYVEMERRTEVPALIRHLREIEAGPGAANAGETP
jgi:hypothetical protein